MKPNNLVGVAPNPPGLRRASLFHFIARSASQDFSTFRPQGEGLFTPSPILSVDHVTAEEQLRQDVRSLREKHRKLETDALWEAGSVITKITVGRVAVAAIDVLRRQAELLDQLEGAGDPEPESAEPGDRPSLRGRDGLCPCRSLGSRGRDGT
jgi:hypothetical protein